MSTFTGFPAFNAWYIELAPSVSTPHIRICGLRDFSTVAMPASIAPPPTATNTSVNEGQSSISSSARVPYPSATSVSLQSSIMWYPCSASVFARSNAELTSLSRITVLPEWRIFSMDEAGAFFGIITVTFRSSALAASATAIPKLPPLTATKR